MEALRRDEPSGLSDGDQATLALPRASVTVASMSRPADRTTLLARIDTDFGKLLEHVVSIAPAARLEPGACEAWSVKDILAHLDAWHEMFLGWERVGADGSMPDLPAPGYGWKDTPRLNEAIWQRTRGDDYDTVFTRLTESHARVREAVEGYDDDALFEKGRYRWTGTTSVGSYAVSATTSHYDWATKLIRRFARTRQAERPAGTLARACSQVRVRSRSQIRHRPM